MKFCALFLVAVSACLAQPHPDDTEGCKDSRLVNRFKGCHIYQCKITEHDSAEIPVAKGADGDYTQKTLEGQLESISFQCPENVGTLQIIRNMEGAFGAKGFKRIFYDRAHASAYELTLQNGPQWVWVHAYEQSYDLITVLSKAAEQQLEATAEAWTKQIEEGGRVSVYGIQFDTAKATIKPESEKALSEIVKLLHAQADWQLTIVGHTDNVGTKPANMALSRQRAEAVVSWLAGKGIDKSRLTAAGLGDTKPVGDNSTEEGRAQNRRVELVKL